MSVIMKFILFVKRVRVTQRKTQKHSKTEPWPNKDKYIDIIEHDQRPKDRNITRN
jgi:hypothetical protein